MIPEPQTILQYIGMYLCGTGFVLENLALEMRDKPMWVHTLFFFMTFFGFGLWMGV